MMNVVLKMMNFSFKMMDFAFKMMISELGGAPSCHIAVLNGDQGRDCPAYTRGRDSEQGAEEEEASLGG